MAVAEVGGEVRSLGTIPNRVESVRRLVGKLGKPASLKVCYEAGPTGYVLYWQLSELGVHCEVVAPTLVPVKAGDRVKTDRRDAEKLARCYRAGDLTAVWVPDTAHEALRDLVRARLAAKRDQLRARHRLGKFLLRQGRRAPEGTTAWTGKYLAWVKQQHFEQAAQEATLLDYLHEVEHAGARIVRLERAIDAAVESMPEHMREMIAGLQSLRGVAKISAVTLVAELGQISRFGHARQLMGYAGIVSREHSSGQSVRRGSISKAGNALPATYRDGGGLELPASSQHRRHVGSPPERGERSGQSHRLAGTASPACALSSAAGQGQEQAESHHRAGPRVARLHLGNRL